MAIYDSSGWKVKASAGAAWQQLAFPGARGHGALSTGGRDGTIMLVTNTNNSGANSLIDAVESTTTPRAIVLRAAGYIESVGQMVATVGGMSIVGQTAPGGGITVRRAIPNPAGIKGLLTIAPDDIANFIVQYLTLRNGEGTVNQAVAIRVRGGNQIIIDHCTVGWGKDDQFQFHKPVGTHELRNGTAQRCMVHDALQSHSTGLKVTANSDAGLDDVRKTYDITFWRNLIANCTHRAPTLNTGKDDETQGDEAINNVTYNYRNKGLQTHEGLSICDVVHNVFLTGPGTDADRSGDLTPIEILLEDNGGDFANFGRHASIFLEGNISPDEGLGDSTQDYWNSLITHEIDNEFPDKATFERTTKLTAALAVPEVLAAESVQADVLGDVGNNGRLEADGTLTARQDTRMAGVIDDVNDRTGPSTGTNWDEVADFGGWPTLDAGTAWTMTSNDGIADTWKTNNALDPSTDYCTPGAWSKDAYGISFAEHFWHGTKIRWRHGGKSSGIGRGASRGVM